MKATKGKIVSIDYQVTDEEGSLIDSSADRRPLSYLHGFGQIIPGLERALEGQEEGFVSTVTVPPEEAYGDRDPDAVFSVPRDRLPDDIELEPGMQVGAETPGGPIQLTVVEVGEEEAVLDANHPLAGKTLTMEVEITGIRDASEAEREEAAGLLEERAGWQNGGKPA